MNVENIRMNPMNRAQLYPLPEEPQKHLERTQALLRKSGVRVMLVENALDGNDHWLNDTIPMGMPAAGLTVVPDEGAQLLISGYHLVPQGKAERLPGLPWSQTSAQIVSGLSAQDLTELLHGTNRLGVIYPERMRASVYDYLMEQLPDLELVDMTDTYAMVKAVRSPEELEVIQQVTKQCDVIFGAVPSMVRTGLYERDVVGELRRTAYKTGSGGYAVFYQAMVDLFSVSAETQRETAPIFWPGRMLQQGDIVSVRAHISGMNGFYGCLGRCYVLGKASAELQDQWDTAVKAQQLTAAAMVPGSTLEQAGAAAEALIRSQGYEPDLSSSIYALGYWMSEAPMLGHPTAKLPLKAGMVFVVAPGVKKPDGDIAVACADTYVVTDTGAVRLNQSPQELVCL